MAKTKIDLRVEGVTNPMGQFAWERLTNMGQALSGAGAGSDEASGKIIFLFGQVASHMLAAAGRREGPRVSVVDGLRSALADVSEAPDRGGNDSEAALLKTVRERASGLVHDLEGLST